ncbi:MAG: competence/damage-inducible protein A [Myxococcales bacterium]|nr:competence/damage-inducible protein A [Myxococcales bacterium]
MSRDGAWILTIGDELVRGEITDSNKSFLSERLLRLDIESTRHVTVADDPAAIEEVLRLAAERARVVLVTGGLGPTRDDITTEVAARTFARRLVRDPGVLERIQGYFRSVGREMTENNAKQADLPEGAELLPNALGTAPGFMLEQEGALLCFMPGVPKELYRMVDEELLPRLEARRPQTGVVRASLWRTFGIGESALDRDLEDLARRDPSTTLGFRTQFPDNLVRIVVRAKSEPEARRKLAAAEAELRERLGPLLVGSGEQRLESITGELLQKAGLRVAVAESCTGGLIASRLTDVPGSSRYLLAGFVAYSNEAKVRELGVRPEELDRHGAVSEMVVRQMAEGARERTGADLAIATTGIAGPDGGSDEKPVGTLWLGIADAAGTEARRYQLMRERGRNKELATQIGLEWIRRRVLGLPLPDETFPRLRAVSGAAR